jgi:hypothetical protein
VDEKHHILPQFLLQRFASAGQIVLCDRGLRRLIPTSIERALRIGSFYRLEGDFSIPRSELEKAIGDLSAVPGLRDSILDIGPDTVRLKPDAVEAFLSHMEGRAAEPLSRLSAQGPPSTTGRRAHERFDIANLIGLQLVRGQVFRDSVDEILRAYFREQILAAPAEMVDRWRRFEKTRGRPPVDDPIEHILAALDRIELAAHNKLGEMLPMAFREMAPRIFARTWRLLRFETPDVITSDEGVGLWARPVTALNLKPLAMATADAIYFPIDARHTLQLTRTAPSEEIVAGSEAKLRHSNNAVASAAYRWIVAHPDNVVLGQLQVQARPRLHRHELSVEDSPDGLKRSIIAFMRTSD